MHALLLSSCKITSSHEINLNLMIKMISTNKKHGTIIITNRKTRGNVEIIIISKSVKFNVIMSYKINRGK